MLLKTVKVVGNKENQETVTDQRKLERQENKMQCGSLDRILEHTKAINGKTREIKRKPRI